MTENQNLAISAAKGSGIKVVNVGAEDIIEGQPHLILGLVWQMVNQARWRSSRRSINLRSRSSSGSPPCLANLPVPDADGNLLLPMRSYYSSSVHAPPSFCFLGSSSGLAGICNRFPAAPFASRPEMAQRRARSLTGCVEAGAKHGLSSNASQALSSEDIDVSKLRKLFASLDTDGSGSITAGEMRSALTKMGADPAAADDVIEDSDANGDNKVTFEEFAKAAQRGAEIVALAKKVQGYGGADARSVHS